MKFMKIFAIIFITINLAACKSVQFEKNPPFQIIEATHKSWVGGLPGVHGINVFITYTSKKTIAFDSIYFRNKVVRLEMKEINGIQHLTGRFNTSKVNSRKDLILHRDTQKEVGNEPPKIKFQFDLNSNDAVISYRVAGKTKFHKVFNIKKERTGFYP